METCSVCENEIPEPAKDSISTGFGRDLANNIVCYPCCGVQDKVFMKAHGKIALYLTIKDNKAVVTNWPDSIRFNCWHYSTGRHNIAGVRYDCWFGFDGFVWHGVTYGDNTQICHCKRTKETLTGISTYNL